MNNEDQYLADETVRYISTEISNWIKTAHDKEAVLNAVESKLICNIKELRAVIKTALKGQ